MVFHLFMEYDEACIMHLRPKVSKKFKDLKLLVTVTVNLRFEVEVSKMKSILKLILSLIS